MQRARYIKRKAERHAKVKARRDILDKHFKLCQDILDRQRERDKSNIDKLLGWYRNET